MNGVIGVVSVALRLFGNEKRARVVVRVALLTLHGAVVALVCRRHRVLSQVEWSGPFHAGAALLHPLLLDLRMVVLTSSVLEPVRHVLCRYIDWTANLPALICSQMYQLSNICPLSRIVHVHSLFSLKNSLNTSYFRFNPTFNSNCYFKADLIWKAFLTRKIHSTSIR